MELSWRQSKKQSILQLLNQRKNPQVLSLCQCDFPHRRPFQRYCDAESCRDTLCAIINVRHRSRSCGKSRRKAPIESGLQFSIPQNLRVSVVRVSYCTTKISWSPNNMGTACRSTNKWFHYPFTTKWRRYAGPRSPLLIY